MVYEPGIEAYVAQDVDWIKKRSDRVSQGCQTANVLIEQNRTLLGGSGKDNLIKSSLKL